jgi:hypothetical protein
VQIDADQLRDVADVFQQAVTPDLSRGHALGTMNMRRALSFWSSPVGRMLAAELKLRLVCLAHPGGSISALVAMSASVAQMLDSEAVPLLLKVGDVAAHSLTIRPQAWQLGDVSKLVVACATAGACSHRLFSVAPRVIISKLHPNHVPVTVTPHNAANGSHMRPLLVATEGALWAFSVMRMTYPYSAKAVCNASGELLERVLEQSPDQVPADVLIQMLWTMSAMSYHPRHLFARAASVLADKEHDLDAEARESARWFLARAGVAVPVQLLL